jgi:hypothetical protein
MVRPLPSFFPTNGCTSSFCVNRRDSALRPSPVRYFIGSALEISNNVDYTTQRTEKESSPLNLHMRENHFNIDEACWNWYSEYKSYTHCSLLQQSEVQKRVYNNISFSIM